ncbi:MAG: hypothetical protein IT557_13375 [Alphaproteobacteria bacterium]|nr:hypothetical protein [Alphaproteobacteria bacterium]
MRALRSVGVFLLATIVTTVAFIAAAFIFWSFLSVQPGTATALATLFLVAPGIGITAGVVAATRAARATAARAPGASEPGSAEAAAQGGAQGGARGPLRWILTAFTAAVGGLFGYSVALVSIDLGYPHRLIDPASAPPWLSSVPMLAGLSAALLAAWMAHRRRRAGA